jgi:hypothetical protein
VHALHLRNSRNGLPANGALFTSVQRKGGGGIAMVPGLKAEVQGSPWNVLRSRPAKFRAKLGADEVDAEMLSRLTREKRARSGGEEDEEEEEGLFKAKAGER